MGGENIDVVGGSGGGIQREGKCKCCNIMNCGFKLLISLLEVINIKIHTHIGKKIVCVVKRKEEINE
jgi:hypothetical protein